MDTADLLRIIAPLAVALLNLLRGVGQAATADEIEAILLRTDVIAQAIAARARTELGSS